MKVSQFFLRGPLIVSLGTALFCSGGLLRAQGAAAGGEWPRSYTVDDDDVVIYQPKIEKWDQKFLVARFAVGVKGKNDAQPVYGSFVARAETLANAETHMVSVYNVKAEDFKFPDAGDRIEHIKRDIAAVSPEKPLNLSIDKLAASVPAEEGPGDDIVETLLPESSPSKPAETTAAPAKIPAHQPVVMAMEKGVAPQIDTPEHDISKGSDDVPAVSHSHEVKSTVTHDHSPPKEGLKRKAHKDDSASRDDQGNDEETPKVIRHHESIAAPTHDRILHKEEPKPHVVHHLRGDGHLVFFEKKVYLGEHGEVLRHGVKHRILRVKREGQDDRL